MARASDHEKAWAAWRNMQNVLDASPDNSIPDENGERIYFDAPHPMRGGKLGGDIFAHHPSRGLSPCGLYRIDMQGTILIEPKSVGDLVNARLAARKAHLRQAGEDPFHFNWDD